MFDLLRGAWVQTSAANDLTQARIPNNAEGKLKNKTFKMAFIIIHVSILDPLNAFFHTKPSSFQSL